MREPTRDVLEAVDPWRSAGTAGRIRTLGLLIAPMPPIRRRIGNTAKKDDDTSSVLDEAPTSKRKSGTSTSVALSWKDVASASVLFACAMLIYNANGGFYATNDAVASYLVPVNLLNRGTFMFDPRVTPAFFNWKAAIPGGGIEAVNFKHWDDMVLIKGDKKKDTVSNHFKNERIALPGHGVARPLKRPNKYMVSPTKHVDPETKLPLFLSIFGMGTPLTFMPVVYALKVLYGKAWLDSAEAPQALVHIGKVFASGLVAASVAVVFLSCRLLLLHASTNSSVRTRTTTGIVGALLRSEGHGVAVLVSVAYMLGTSVFSISSQALSQHGPAELYVSLGLMCFIRIALVGKETSFAWTVLCSISLSMAVLCRGPLAVVVIAVGATFVSRRQWHTLGVFGLTGIPFLCGLLYYHWYHHGTWYDAGFFHENDFISQVKVKDHPWSAPLARSIPTLLFSPNRGLFFFSPWMLPALASCIRALKSKDTLDTVVVRPLVVAVLLQWVVAFRWFDFWGGWCYGNRPLLDTTPALSVLVALEVFRWLNGSDETPKRASSGQSSKNLALYLFALSIAFAVMLQIVGAWLYSAEQWHNEPCFFVKGESVPKAFTVVAKVKDKSHVTAHSQAVAAEMARAYGVNMQQLGSTFCDIDLPGYWVRAWGSALGGYYDGIGYGDLHWLRLLANWSQSRAKRVGDLERHLKHDI